MYRLILLKRTSAQIQGEYYVLYKVYKPPYFPISGFFSLRGYVFIYSFQVQR